MHNKFEEKTISSDPIFQGKIITVQVDQVKLPNGEISTREIVKHSGAVGVLALVQDRMIVVEQYRKALERSLVEIPAGKLEPGEDPVEAAIRELKEETGYTCQSMISLGSFYTSPGFANELIHLFVAEQLTIGEMTPDEDEFLSCESITLDQAKQYIRVGKIKDAKTIIAIQAWEIYTLTGRF